MVTHCLTGYWLSEELTGDHHHAAGDEERDGPLVEQLECEVIHWDLQQVSWLSIIIINILSPDLSDPQDGLRGPFDQAHRGRHDGLLA